MLNQGPDFTSLAWEALPQAVLIVDAAGRIVSRNAAARATLPAGDHLGDVLTAEPAAGFAWQDDLASLSQAPRGLVRRNLPLSGKGDHRLLVDLTMCLLSAARDDRPAVAMVVVEDVSARASMERRLSASERLTAAGELAARVAHELNNPLDGVLRYVGLAERTCGPKAVEHLAKARSGLQRMGEIIRTLMDDAGPGQTAGRGQPVDRLLDEAIAVMNPRAGSLGVSVMCDIPADACPKLPGSLFQVFCNILKNALDAMPTGGLLKITLRSGGGDCLIEFADTGCGLTEGQEEAIFQPFYTTKPPGEGAGLGLAICREIVTRLGGAISAVNRPEGGVTVTVKLPLAANPATPSEK